MRLRSFAALLAALCLLAGCGSGQKKPRFQMTSVGGSAPAPPAREGAYFGAYVDPGDPAALEKALGRSLDVVHLYHAWGDRFPSPQETAVLNGGRTLLLSLSGADVRAIAEGREDAAIHAQAKAIKQTGKPVFLRWQWDMDSAESRGTVHTAAAYVSAWRRMRQIFHAEAAANVAWVWCPTAQGFGAHAADYYPGDDEVDWVCADAFPDPKAGYGDLSQILKPFLTWAAGHPKPIMIAQFGVPRSYGARRAEWLRDAAQTLQNSQIKAVLYYDADPRGSKDQRRQYSVTGDEAALSALRELATSPYFNPRNLPVSSG